MKDHSGFFRVIAQEAIMGIMAFEPLSRKCVYINNLGRESLEIMDPVDAAIPLRIDDLIVENPGHGLARPFNDELLNSEGLTQDVLMRKKNGYLMMANVGVKHVRLDDNTLVTLVMFQDITIQKKLQREVQAKQEEIHKAYTELLEQNKQLKELDHAKDKFIALTTHELRTPLAAIVATAEVLIMKIYESEQQKEDFINTIFEQSLHLMDLVNDILDFAKIRAGKMEYYIEQVDLLPLIQKSTTNFDHMAVKADVKIECECASEQALAYVDMMRIREVINNVVNNAIKYNRPGGKVKISLAAKGNVLRITVADTGQGIPSDKLVHVFNEFETVGNVSRHQKGTGLGMPISKRLMQGMGGDLTLESQEGVGTSFYIDIPVEKVLPEEVYRSRPNHFGDLAA